MDSIEPPHSDLQPSSDLKPNGINLSASGAVKRGIAKESDHPSTIVAQSKSEEVALLTKEDDEASALKSVPSRNPLLLKPPPIPPPPIALSPIG